MKRAVLIDFLDGYLRIAEIEDYGPQGLQVESDNQQIGRVALAVDTSPAVIEAAVGPEVLRELPRRGPDAFFELYPRDVGADAP